LLEDAQNKFELKSIEDTILRLLDAAEGNILDDDELISTLSASRVTSVKIQDKVKVSERVKIHIDAKRKIYEPVASRAAILFFCIASLANVDPMYQWSMQFYTALFMNSVKKTPKPSLPPSMAQLKPQQKDIERQKLRIKALINVLTESLYSNICRSLFERHKLLFSFLLTTDIFKSSSCSSPSDDSSINTSHLRFFLVGNTSLDLKEPNPTTTTDENKEASFLTDNMWGEILELSSLENFENFSNTFKDNLSFWENVMNSADPLKQINSYLFQEKVKKQHEQRRNHDLDSNSTPTSDGRSSTPTPSHNHIFVPLKESLEFRSLCILRCLRPDKVVDSVQTFIKSVMGNHFVDPPAFDLNSSFEESNCSTPIIFVLSTGADPTADLMKLAEKRGFSKRLDAISLGQGQGPLAANAVSVAIDNGGWVCLQNCHLSISWLPDLERMVENISPETTHQEFRLWLTTLPCNEFPVPVLQSSIKITKEPPKGIRASLIGSYLTFEEEWFESSAHPHAFKYLL
jgi:dynein heavy chain, axonemal